MGLRERVESLTARLRLSRLIVAMPGAGPPVGTLPDGRGLVLHVPPEFEADPRAGLTPAQRALIGPHDQLVLVKYEDRSIDENRGGDTPDADDER